MVNINIYILDRNLNICNTLSSNGDVNSSPFFNDVYKQVLETGVETFEFESMQLDYLENCNYVAFEYKGDLKLFQISEIEDTHEDNLVKRVYCEMAGIELTYEIIRPRMIQSANIRQFLEILLSDTSWNVGYIDEDITDVFTIEISDFEKIYDVIQENIKLFECEIVFRVEKENGIFKKYIDAYKSRGDITNYRFEYSKNIQGISRTVNSFELVTALIGVGKDDLTFKSCEWSKSNGDPIDKPKGQDYIVDESAFRLYNNNGSHLMGYYKCDLDTPYDLLNATYKELKERNTPKVDYEVDITLIDDEANIGDTVYVIDNDWQPTPLHLSARISQLEISFTDKTKNKCTLSNYNRVKSKIKDDLNEILNRIPEDTSFMGISKGGLLSSSIEVNGYRLQIKNKLTDKNGKEYFFRLKDKTSTSFMNNILTKDPKYVTQSFAIDFDESCIYTTQSITETDPHHILITKMNFTGDILGYMRLHGFGHGSQIGIDKIDGVTKIWCECEGRPHTDTGRLYGTKICRFEFVDGAEYTNSTGSVYDIIPNARNIQVAISEETNRLSVKYITYDNKNGFKVFDLRSVLNNRPRVLASFLIPNWLEDSINPNQGHSVYENRIYHYQGGDSQSAEARITVLDFRGNVLDSNIIKDGIGFTNREPEGLYLRCNNGIYELYAGISEGAWPNRKYHIYKYYEGLGSEYEKRGTFIHNNGHSTDIYETIIDTNLDGTARRKEYLIYSSNKTSQFIIGSFKNGSWWVNNELYTPEVNDAIIAELIESDNAMEIILLTNDFESIKGENGQDGSPGQDAIFLELTNEFHSVPTDADGNGGIYAGCETELRLYKGDVQLTDNISYSIKNMSNITGKLDGDKYTVTNLTKDTGYVDLVATYFGKEYIKRFSLSKNKQGLGGEDGLTPTVYWLMTSTSTISKDSKGNLKPSSVTFWAKSQTGEDSVVNYQGIFKIYESIDGNIFTLKHTSELDDTVPYTPSSTAQSIKCELYLNDGVTLIDQDIVNIVKDGTDGFSGADAKYVLLTGEQLFKYTNNFTGTPTPSSITLTGTPFNMSSNNAKWYYKKPSDTNYTLISSNNNKMEFVLNHNDSILFANNNKVVTVKFDIDGYYDEMTIAKVSDGSSGSDGEDGYFVLLTNENHTVPCENNGDVVAGELDKAKTEIHVFKGAQEVSFSLSKTDMGCTSTYNSSTKTLSITSLTSKTATVTMKITINSTVFTKVMTISKAEKGDTGEDSYTVDMTNDNYSFNCDAKGNIVSAITTTTVITAFKGVNPVVPIIGALPTVAGLTLSKSNGIVTIKANAGTSLADNGSFDIPVTVGGNNFIKTFSWTKVKNGSNGSNGISVTSTDVEYAQSSSSTTAPTSGWTTTAPTWQNGKYIWSRTKTVLSDGTIKYTNPACITGQQGQNGEAGHNFLTFTTNYQYDQSGIDTYSKNGYNGTWTVNESTNGCKVGDTVNIRVYNTSKSCNSFIMAKVNIVSSTTVNATSLGLTEVGANGATGTGIYSITEQYYLSTSQTSLSGGSWSTTVPTWQQGKYIWTRSVITYTDNTTTTTNGICVSGSKGDKGDKGDAGTNGTNGVNGTSPVLVTISGQQSMKYLDKTSAPTPSTITLTANVMEGNVVVSSGITYIWQYKNSSGTWVNLSGTYTSKTYSLAHNNTGFVNEVAQIRVAVSYKSKTYYLEHTVTKIYDNKYISKQEVFDKITEGGTNQLIYKDPSTGEIYINATFIKSGQLVADLIKGGILTLGGTGNSDTGDYGRFRILDSTGQNELASMDGGEMRMVNLQAEELNATNLNVKNINCATYAPAIYEYTKVYVNTTNGNDDVDFESGAIFKTLQGALDAAPKNLNGFTTEIVLQTAVSENIVIRGFSGGTLNILMNSKNINGYVVARDCSAQVFILGGLTTTDIPDGINNTGLRPNIQPSQLFSFGGYNYSFVAIGCAFVYVRSIDIFGKTGTTTNYCGGSVNGSNVYVQNVNAYASNSGWNVTTGGKMTTKETYGRCERLAYNVQLGGVTHICNGNSTGAPSNIYTGNGGQVVQGNVTFVGSGDVGSNDNTTTNSTSVTLNASSGDSYKVKYSSWRKDNSVRQGDWSSTGMNKGCWFFGNQFADLKGKTIKSVKLTLQRQSGGNSGAVAFTLKMHNHIGRPSGVPSYLSEWSKNISLTVGQSTTITITDSAVLTAIKNGTMKGFGIEVSSTSNSYYGILTPKLKAVVTY